MLNTAGRPKGIPFGIGREPLNWRAEWDRTVSDGVN